MPKGHPATQQRSSESRRTCLPSTKPWAGPSPLFTCKPRSLLLSWHSPSDGGHCCSYTISLFRNYPELRRKEKRGVGTLGAGFVPSSDLQPTFGWNEACWPHACRWEPTNNFDPVKIYLYARPSIKHWCYSEVPRTWPFVLRKGTVCKQFASSQGLLKKEYSRENDQMQRRDERWLNIRGGFKE